jgi:flagellar basal-body rod protein FlgG
MVAGMLQQDVIAQNLANIDTPGYKRDVALVGSFGREMAVRVERQVAGQLARSVPLGWVGFGSHVRGTGFDKSDGPIVETGAPLDLAIQGDGYFVVERAEGAAYTRSGSFTLNAEGELVTQQGAPVLGESGRIVIPSGANVEVRGDGSVVVDGKMVARLRLVSFDYGFTPEKAGQDVFVAPRGMARSIEAGDGTVVRQGFLEMSNVSAVKELVQMIAGMRAYEACQRVVWFLDQTLDKSINDVGRPA